MSRFDSVDYTQQDADPYLSVYATGARFNRAAIDRHVGDAETVTFRYDEAADDLGLFFDADGSDARKIWTVGQKGATTSIQGTLNTNAVGIDPRDLEDAVRLPVKHDGIEDVPYVPLAPLREALGQPLKKDASNESVEDGGEDEEIEPKGDADDRTAGIADGGTTIEPQAADYSGNPDVDQMVAQSSPRVSPEAASEDAPGGLSDEERILALIKENDGRMRQSEIHGGIGRSKGHVSRLLKEMDERGEVEKIRLGRSNIITLPDFDSGDSPDVDEEEESEDADRVDEGAEEVADSNSIELDLTQVDMTRVRELLPPNAGVMDVVEHVRSSQSSFGVARSIGVPREQAELLLEELDLDEHITMGGGSA